MIEPEIRRQVRLLRDNGFKCCHLLRTRSERIRTASEVVLSFSLTEAEAPAYQRIARDVERLHALGLSLNKIAQHLGLDDKTVAKALRWNQNLTP